MKTQTYLTTDCCWCLVLSLVLCLPPAIISAAEPAGVRSALQTGLFEEEANRNLEAAIQAYQSVVKLHDEDRKFGATAVFRLGECYRKLGQTNEAVVQYQRLLRDFSDHARLVELSRENLTALGASPFLPGSQAVAQARQEQRRLLEEEIKLVESQLKTLQVRVQAGRISSTEVMDQERQLLQLRRQLVAFDAGLEPTPGMDTAKFMASTNEEEQEIRRIQALIQNSPDLINAKDSGTGATPLHQATSKGQLVVARFLLSNGAQVNLTDNNSVTPLHYAADKGHLSMTELLLASGAQINARDFLGLTPLHQAVAKGFVAVTEALLKHQADPNLPRSARPDGFFADFAGHSPLHTAIAIESLELVNLLLANGADASQKTIREQTILHIAASVGNADILKRLLKLDDLNVNARDENEQTPLHRADNGRSPEVVQILLAAGAEVEAKDKSKNTPLALVFAGTWHMPQTLQIAELLLKNGAGVNSQFNGTPLLHLAVQRGDPPMLSLLLAYRPNLESTDPNGLTALQTAVARFADNSAHAMATQLVELLLKAGADPDHAFNAIGRVKTINRFSGNHRFESTGSTPLVAAAWSENLGVVKALLANGANVNAKSAQGLTPLHYALYAKNRPLIETILANHPNLEMVDHARKAPLMIAIEANEARIVELLLDAGAEVNAKSTDGEAPLHLAIRTQSEDIVKLLLSHKAGVNMPGKDGMSPLHYAVGYHQPNILELLLAAGADVNIPDAKGKTPLDYVKEERPSGQPPPPRSVPVRGVRPPPRASSVAASNPTTAQSEMAQALRAAGALDWASRPGQITVIRRSTGAIESVFQQDTNGFNRFTLLETLAALPWVANSNWVFPDWAGIKILRRNDTNAELQEIAVDLTKLTTNDCSANVWLEWGDLVEIPEREHKLNEPWNGLPVAPIEAIAKCIQRAIVVRVKGQSHPITLQPPWTPTGMRKTDGAHLKPIGGFFQPFNFWLRKTVLESGFLLTSSDTTRVKVQRTDPATGQKHEWLFDLTQDLPTKEALRLRDGDVIEVPEKE